VHGLEGLQVIDASVVPAVISTKKARADARRRR
jgi:hypothetical protein